MVCGVVLHRDGVAPGNLDAFTAVLIDKVVVDQGLERVVRMTARLRALEIVDDDAVAIGVRTRLGDVVVRDVVLHDIPVAGRRSVAGDVPVLVERDARVPARRCIVVGLVAYDLDEVRIVELNARLPTVVHLVVKNRDVMDVVPFDAVTVAALDVEAVYCHVVGVDADGGVGAGGRPDQCCARHFGAERDVACRRAVLIDVDALVVGPRPHHDLVAGLKVGRHCLADRLKRRRGTAVTAAAAARSYVVCRHGLVPQP